MAAIDSYTDDDTWGALYSTIWIGMSFTTSQEYSIASVKLKLYRSGNPGIVTVSIRETTDGLPTGEDLCSGTIDGDTLTTDTAGEWKEITFSSSASLSNATLYAIIFRAPSGDVNSLRYRQNVPGEYAGGGTVSSTNSGSSWSSSLLYDIVFETYADTTTILSLAGTVAGVSTVEGAIGANPVSVLGLAGTSAGTSTVTGAIGANPVSVLGLVGTSAGTSSVTGAINVVSYTLLSLAGLSAGVSTITGLLSKASTSWQPPSVTQWLTGYGYYRLLVIDGEWGTPPPDGVEDVDYTIVSLLPSALLTTRKLVCAANNKLWIEDIQ